MAIKTHKVTLSLDNPRVIQSGINVQSFDKQSIQISIELTKNDEVFQVPSYATIRISLLKLARQEQRIIVDVPNTNRDSIDWVVPDYLDGYQGTVRVGVYLVSGAENVDLGYFTILSNVSDIDKMADEFVDNVFQGWEQIEADLNELNLTIAQTKLDLADDLTQVDNTIANINTLASDFTADVATKQADVTSKYNAFDTSVTQANQTIDDILALQPQFQAVLDETTGKDVISAPEIILARNGEADLKTRLDKDQQQVTAQLAQIVQLSAKNKGAIADGLIDDFSIFSTIITEVGSNKTELHLPKGNYKIGNNLTFPSNITLIFQHGAKFLPIEGKKIVIHGEVVAGNYTIFDGAGIVDMHLSSSPIMLSWYSGDSFNVKWDKIQNTLVAWRPFKLIVPKPHPNQEGSELLTPSDIDWWVWKLTAPFKIDKRATNGIIQLDGELKAVGIVSSGLLIDSTSLGKVDNIVFTNGITIRGTNNVDNYFISGIEIEGCARIYFEGKVDIQHCVDGLVLGGTNHAAPIGQLHFESLHVAFVTAKHIRVETGNKQAVIGVRIKEIVSEQCVNVGQDTILIKGKCQDITFGDIVYISGEGNNAGNIVLLQTSVEGSPIGVKLGNIYATNATGAGIKSEDTTGGTASKIEEISVGYVKVIGGSALNLNYTTKFTLPSSVASSNAIVIGIGCTYTFLNVNLHNNITDSGTFTFINGLHSVARGTGILPDINGYSIGQRMFNTSDNTLWERVRRTGNAVSDFVKIGEIV